MTFGVAPRARSLMESGRYKEAAELFVAAGELAAAARAFACASDFFRAAVCYEKAHKPLDAARLYHQIRHWSKAAELYTLAGDAHRARQALEELKNEQEDLGAAKGPATAWAHAPVIGAAPAPAATPVAAKTAPASPAPGETWPAGEIWQAIRSGDTGAAANLYLRDASRSGWELIAEARSPEALKALAETLFQARDHAAAAEAFHKAGDMLRSAQCLSLAGLNEEAAHYYFKLGRKDLAAQHLEKAEAWDQAAELYLQENLFLDAARCQEKNDDPVKAAALYLKARQPDLALPLLQSVPPAHRAFAPCRLLAGKILFQKGQKDLAFSLLAPLLDTITPTDEGLDVFYQAAVLLEQGGAAGRAAEAYQRLQETRFGFKDVTERLRKLAPSSQPADPPVEHAASVATAFAAASLPSPPSPSPPPLAPSPPPATPPPLAAGSAIPPAAVDLSPLRDCSLFNRLGNDELRRLWSIGKTGECKPGKVILRSGEVSPGLMVVLSGGVTITPTPANPGPASGFLGPGDYVGLGSLLNGPPQPNALVAQRGTRLLVLPLEALESLLSSEPDMGLRFYRSVAEHLVRTLMAEKPRSGEAWPGGGAA